VNTKILEESFLRFRLSPKPVTVVGMAVSDRAAKATMYIDEPGSAKNTLSRKWVDTLREDGVRFGHTLSFGESREVQTATLDELMALHGNPYFIKIDVEGHEPEVLRGLRKPVPYLSYEVNLPEFRTEGLECVEILNRLDSRGAFNYAVDCRVGLVLQEWLGARDFSAVFTACTDPSIEVFWKAASA
jgi:FkbM family methyltransferase